MIACLILLLLILGCGGVECDTAGHKSRVEVFTKSDRGEADDE